MLRWSQQRHQRLREMKAAGVEAAVASEEVVEDAQEVTEAAGVEAEVASAMEAAVAVLEVTAAVDHQEQEVAMAGTVGVASEVVASAGQRIGRGRRWARAQARSKAR